MTHPAENDPIDSVLASLTDQYQQKSSSVPQKNQPSDDLLADIEAKFQQKKPIKNNSQKFSAVDDALISLTQNLQEKIKPRDQISSNDFEEIKKKELEAQRKAKAEARRKEELARAEAQKIEQLTKKAEVWLKNLDINSDEGFWFSQFAMSYDSKLKAAMDYLKALEN
ncbi:MAG: salt stress protein, Slr1339 family [Cyanobacterium sp.]